MVDSKNYQVIEKRDIPVISRVQRNHGLEHATLHILSQRYPKQSLAGHSDTAGFWIIGDVTIEDVYESVEEALSRLRNGEKHLAVHRNCGTNFVTSGSYVLSHSRLDLLPTFRVLRAGARDNLCRPRKHAGCGDCGEQEREDEGAPSHNQELIDGTRSETGCLPVSWG